MRAFLSVALAALSAPAACGFAWSPLAHPAAANSAPSSGYAATRPAAAASRVNYDGSRVCLLAGGSGDGEKRPVLSGFRVFVESIQKNQGLKQVRTLAGRSVVGARGVEWCAVAFLPRGGSTCFLFKLRHAFPTLTGGGGRRNAPLPPPQLPPPIPPN